MGTRGRYTVVTTKPLPQPAARVTSVSHIPSLLFMMDLEEDNGRRGTDGRADDELAEELQRFLAPTNEWEVRLINDVKGIVTRLAEHSSGILMECVAEDLIRLGYSVRLHTSLGGGDGSECLHNLRHSFLTVTFPGSNLHAAAAKHPASRRYIVDPHFKEQFQIAKPTPRYAAITAVLPPFYVGLEEQLPPLVSFLVSELGASFYALSCVLPPWRHLNSMLSKWKPRRSLDEPYRSTNSIKSASSSGADKPDKSTTEAEMLDRLANRQGGKDGFGLLVRHTSDPLEKHSSELSDSFRKIVGTPSRGPVVPSITSQKGGFTVTRMSNQLPTSRLSNFSKTFRPLVTSSSNLDVVNTWPDFELPPLRPATADSVRGGRKIMEPQRIYGSGDFSNVPTS